MGIAESLMGSLEAAGGGVALVFLVGLAVGIVAMMAIYLASAVVVLERFARVARRPVPVFFFGLAVSVLAAAVLAENDSNAIGRPFKEWLGYFYTYWMQTGAATVVAIGLVALVLGRVSPERISTAVLVLLGFCVGVLTATGLPWAYPLVLILLCGLTHLALRWRRQREPLPREPGGLERNLRWLLFSLLPAPAFVPLADDARFLAMSAAAGLVSLLMMLIFFGLLPLAAAGILVMRKSVEWFIAVRYLVAKRRQVFISAITAICVGGVAAGVWLIVVVLSVMNGFEQTWRDEILGNRAHFTVHSGFGPISDYDRILDQVRQVPGVLAAAPYIDCDGMVRGQEGEISSVRLRGIDPKSVGNVTDLRNDIVAGSLDALEDPSSVLEEFGSSEGEADTATDLPGIVIGNQLALSLGVRTGDSMLLISPFGGPPTPLGPAPRLKRFRVVGVFKSSFYQYDGVYTYTTLAAAQEFRRAGPVVDGIEARTTDHYRSQAVGRLVEEALGYPYYTRDWKQVFPAFFQALKTERVMMFLLLLMIQVVAAFVIVATLIMMIMEKSSDIAILKAMGAGDALIERIFALEGVLIGIAGTCVGLVAGIAVTGRLPWLQDQIELLTGIDTLPASVYQIGQLPSKVDPIQVMGVVLISMIFSLGATLLPSRQGARIDPAEGLRHE